MSYTGLELLWFHCYVRVISWKTHQSGEFTYGKHVNCTSWTREFTFRTCEIICHCLLGTSSFTLLLYSQFHTSLILYSHLVYTLSSTFTPVTAQLYIHTDQHQNADWWTLRRRSRIYSASTSSRRVHNAWSIWSTQLPIDKHFSVLPYGVPTTNCTCFSKTSSWTSRLARSRGTVAVEVDAALADGWMDGWPHSGTSSTPHRDLAPTHKVTTILQQSGAR